jgi:hypothetical protein
VLFEEEEDAGEEEEGEEDELAQAGFLRAVARYITLRQV